MGVVYEGFDPSIERIVALKTVRADQLGGEDAPEILTRFRREAQAAGRLTHPNVVAVYELGEDAGTTFIAMEFVKGRSLKEYLEQHTRFTTPQLARIMTELLAALDYSHRNGVVHRDIKPANVMILEDGTVKVADFGIARIEQSNLTQTGMILGTPSYMSPEQFMGQTVDGRSDLFSAGVILYELLTGEKPFSGSATTIMHKVLQEEPLPPSTLNVQVPRPFDGVVKRALAKRPDERFQTAREFAEAIKAAVEGREAPAATDATVVGTATMTKRAAQAPIDIKTDPTQSTIRTVRQPAARLPRRRPQAAPARRGSRSRSSAAIAAIGHCGRGLDDALRPSGTRERTAGRRGAGGSGGATRGRAHTAAGPAGCSGSADRAGHRAGDRRSASSTRATPATRPTRRCCSRTSAPIRRARRSRRRSAFISTAPRSRRTTTRCATSCCRRARATSRTSSRRASRSSARTA